MKDKDELALESLFRADPIADDGFSHGVMKRLRRRIWLQRLALPVAVALGAVIAFRPALEVLRALYGLVGALPSDLVKLPVDAIPQMSSIVIVVTVVIATLCLAPAFED